MVNRGVHEEAPSESVSGDLVGSIQEVADDLHEQLIESFDVPVQEMVERAVETLLGYIEKLLVEVEKGEREDYTGIIAPMVFGMFHICSMLDLHMGDVLADVHKSCSHDRRTMIEDLIRQIRSMREALVR